MELKDIDIAFDVRSDSKGKDPDIASPTLKEYHRLLWSKPLPNGQFLELSCVKGGYLRWNDMYFGSDSIIVSFNHEGYGLRKQIQDSIPNFKDYHEDYLHKTYTIAGSVIFPCLKGSMNQEKGINPRIKDRWDLTLECIRRFYDGEQSPLGKALDKSSSFFELFIDFKGYVDFFLLQDCVDEAYNVKLWLNTPLFKTNPFPMNVEEYTAWIDKELNFVEKRGERIKSYCRESTIIR